MTKPDRQARKFYAMRRMTLAIERAIGCPTEKEKQRAARWAAAWGLLCGIRTEGVNLRACDVQRLERRRRHRPEPSPAQPAGASAGQDPAASKPAGPRRNHLSTPQ